MEPPIHRGAIGALLGPGDFPQEIPLINPARPFGHLIYPSVTPATPSPAHNPPRSYVRQGRVVVGTSEILPWMTEVQESEGNLIQHIGKINSDII